MSLAKNISNKQMFLSVANAIRTVTEPKLNISSYKDTDKMVKNLKEYFQTITAPLPQDFYKYTYIGFCLKYLLTNVMKNYNLVCMLQRLDLLSNCKNIVDLGSGPGTFALSYLIWLQEEGKDVKSNVKIYLIDAVQEFLDIFQEFWDQINSYKKKLIKVEKITSFIDGYLPQGCCSPDLIILSNSLSEILRNPIVKYKKFVQGIKKEQPIIAIIDYHYDSHSALLKTFAREIATRYKNVSFGTWPIVLDYYELVDLGNVHSKLDKKFSDMLNINRNVKFLRSIWLPSKRNCKKNINLPEILVAKYKRAWENHDFQILSELFTDDAIYIEKKKGEPLKGLNEICNYWRINSKQQSFVHFEPYDISWNGNTLKAKWKCNFYRKDILRWIKLEGEFEVLTRDGQIYYFSEEFSKKYSSYQP